MRISIRGSDAPFPFVIHLPIGWVRRRFVARIIVSAMDLAETKENTDRVQQAIKDGYAELKAIAKQKKRFDLIEVHSHDGDHILVRL